MLNRMSRLLDFIRLRAWQRFKSYLCIRFQFVCLNNFCYIYFFIFCRARRFCALPNLVYSTYTKPAPANNVFFCFVTSMLATTSSVLLLKVVLQTLSLCDIKKLKIKLNQFFLKKAKLRVLFLGENLKTSKLVCSEKNLNKICKH